MKIQLADSFPRFLHRLGRRAVPGVLALAAVVSVPAAESSAALRQEALAAMKNAATFYRTKVALHGGYTYFTSLDLKQHWGEGEGTPDQLWVEPPGTPSVGLAYLGAYRATGDQYYLDAARETGVALAYGQLKSGGWRQTIDFNPKGKHVGLYRNGQGSGPNHSSLDDDQTQSAIIFMAQLDKALEFKDPAIHDSATFALSSLLTAQFPNGGFPQGWSEPVAAKPVLKASYPKNWPRLWPHEPYHIYYTLNDGLVGTVSNALLVAIESYHDDRYRQALAKLGDFLILAQMPDPQPAWCQQYDFNMQPTWARKFEPPAVCGLESEDAIRTLMKVYRATGDKKYLEPIPRALAYLKTCVLPDGRMARYRELETNRPLYMTRKPGVSGNSNAPGYYDFSYEDTNLPKHYGWKQPTAIKELAEEFAELQSGAGKAARTEERFTKDGKLIAVLRSEAPGSTPESLAALAKEVRAIIQAQDKEGRWVDEVQAGQRLVGQPDFKVGFRFIGSHTFNYNMEILSHYLAATAGR